MAKGLVPKFTKIKREDDKSKREVHEGQRITEVNIRRNKSQFMG